MVWPARFHTRAPAGGCTFAPTAVMSPSRMTTVALGSIWPGAVTTRAPTRAWKPVPLSRSPVTGSVREVCWASRALAATSRPTQPRRREQFNAHSVRKVVAEAEQDGRGPRGVERGAVRCLLATRQGRRTGEHLHSRLLRRQPHARVHQPQACPRAHAARAAGAHDAGNTD